MKWLVSIVAVAMLAHCAVATELEEDAGDARYGYFTVGSGGTTTLTFNATSIQNGVILALFIFVLGALIIPLYTGVFNAQDTGYEEPASGYGYGYEAPASGYEEPAYHGYAKRYNTTNLKLTISFSDDVLQDCLGLGLVGPDGCFANRGHRHPSCPHTAPGHLVCCIFRRAVCCKHQNRHLHPRWQQHHLLHQ